MPEKEGIAGRAGNSREAGHPAAQFAARPATESGRPLREPTAVNCPSTPTCHPKIRWASASMAYRKRPSADSPSSRNPGREWTAVPAAASARVTDSRPRAIAGNITDSRPAHTNPAAVTGVIRPAATPI